MTWSWASRQKRGCDSGFDLAVKTCAWDLMFLKMKHHCCCTIMYTLRIILAFMFSQCLQFGWWPQGWFINIDQKNFQLFPFLSKSCYLVFDVDLKMATSQLILDEKDIFAKITVTSPGGHAENKMTTGKQSTFEFFAVLNIVLNLYVSQKWIKKVSSGWI